MYIKKIALLPAIALAFTPFATHADFPDVPQNSEYYQSISALQDLGVIEGYENGEFDQSRQVSRAEFLKMVLLTKREIAETEYLKKLNFPGVDNLKIDLSCFPDVKASDWFAPYVCWAKQEGIIDGYEDGKFHPENIVNVAEAAKILAGSKNESIEGHWANGYFARFGSMGLPATIQSPDQILNRADIAELIWRYSLAAPKDLVNKPGKIFVWDKDHYLNLDYIGTVYNYVVGQLYAKDENKVYGMEFDNGDFIPSEILGADPGSFKVVTSIKNYGGEDDFTYNIALDDHALYIRNKIIPQSAGSSFELLDEHTSNAYNSVIYGKDAENVYPIVCYEGCALGNPYPDADLSTFKVLDVNYSKDKNRVYFIEGSFKAKNIPTLLEADTHSFEVLGYGYAKDNKHAFYLDNILESINLDAFKVFTAYYFSSGNEVYFRDSDHTYTPLEGVDLSSFEAFAKDISAYSGSGFESFAKDKNQIYYSGKPLIGVDVETFTYDSSIYKWKDKNKTYTLGEIYEMAGL